MAPSVECPECGQRGEWELHCDTEECTWLKCPCRMTTYAMLEQQMNVRWVRDDK